MISISDIKQLKEKYDSMYIYGVGKYAKVLTLALGKEWIKSNATAFIVTSYEDNPKTYEGLPVLEIDSLLDKCVNGIVIMAIAPLNAKEAVRKVEQMSFEKIILIDEDTYEQLNEKASTAETMAYYHNMVDDSKLFKYIEIETINRCNGLCSFCPVNAKEEQRPYYMMEEKLFYSIIQQLKEENYSGQVGLFSNNEPFLDKRIISFAKYARENLPNAFLYLFTNGTLLDEKKYLDIMPYLDMMQIDLYLEADEPEPENISRIRTVAVANGYNDKMVYFTISPKEIRYSRGGSSPNSKVNSITEELCRLPLIQMVIRPDGKVSLCCNDALGQMTLGDVNEERIVDIWNGEKYRDIRRKAMDGRENIDLCKYCNSIDRREL